LEETEYTIVDFLKSNQPDLATPHV
jgi:hypothetical protein